MPPFTDGVIEARHVRNDVIRKVMFSVMQKARRGPLGSLNIQGLALTNCTLFGNMACGGGQGNKRTSLVLQQLRACLATPP